MTADSEAARRHVPTVLCAGIAVLDQVFRVARFPVAEVKTQASEFLPVNGGNAANAAVAIAHLGGQTRFVAPLGGPPGEDFNGDRFLALLGRENIDCSACTRMPGVPSPISAISVDARGERAIVNFRDDRLAAARPSDPAMLVSTADAVMADNRFPEFVLPICAAARDRGIPVVLDADEPRRQGNDLLSVASHVVFSAEGLRATTGTQDLAAALRRASEMTSSFLAVTDGTNDVLWLEEGRMRAFSVFKVEAVDTLGAGDVFHGAFALLLAEGRGERDAIRFAAAAAAIKCTRFGGITGAPGRDEVEAFLTVRGASP
jgi:sugar/nucleoside kinase (ribokinase family)